MKHTLSHWNLSIASFKCLQCRRSEGTQKRKIAEWTFRCSKSRMRRNETPYPIWMKLCRMVDVHDVITCANFGDDRLRSLGLAVGGAVKCCPSSLPLIVVPTVWVCDKWTIVKRSDRTCLSLQCVSRSHQQAPDDDHANIYDSAVQWH